MRPPVALARSVVRGHDARRAMAFAVCVGIGLVVAGSASAQPGRPPADPVQVADEVDGNALIDRGQLAEGVARLAAAERTYRQRVDRRGQARVALKQSTTLRRLAQPEASGEAARRALALTRDDRTIRIGALTELGLLASDRADFDEADRRLSEALPMAEAAGDATVEAAVLRALGRVRDGRGQQADALAYFERAVAAADRSGALPPRVAGRVMASVSLLGLARYDEALARAEEASALAAGSTNASVRGDALFNLAQAHGHVWNLDRAAELWTAAIEAHQAAGNVRSVAVATKQRIDVLFAQGDFDRAAADGERVIDLLRQARFESLLPETMARLALSEARRRRLETAVAWAARARADVTATPAARHIYVFNDLGLVALESGDSGQALADFTRVRDVAVQIGNVEYEWRAWWGLGRARSASGDLTAARAALDRAIGLVERLRQTIPEAALRAVFMTNRVGPYDSLVEVTMRASRAPDDQAVRDALHVAERARSRALADLLAEARARPADPRLQAVRDREIAFGRRLTAAARSVASAADDAARAAAADQLRALEHEYDTFVLEIRRDNAAYAALTHPQPLAADAITRMLGPQEALVEFLVTESRGYAWVVRGDEVRAYAIPGQDALAPRVRLLSALVAGNDLPGLERLGAELYAQLLAPAEPALRGVRRLIVVPDGALQRVPFALLRNGDQWLVERYTLALAPSATILDHLRQTPAGRGARPLLAMAAPDSADGQAALFDLAPGTLHTLAFAADEVATARRRTGAAAGDTHVGAAATEAVLKSPDAADYRIVHLAAHAVVDEQVPRRSAVLLASGGSDDGLLRLSEVANLSLAADLVVLAACRSNLGRVVRGEGLLSLSRAFLHAGARAVVASSWAVDDRESTWLMEEFYRSLGSGLAPDAALQQAQRRAIAAGGRWAAPRNWAAYVVIGEGGVPILTPSSTWLSRTMLSLVGVVAAAIAWRAFRRRGRRAPSAA